MDKFLLSEMSGRDKAMKAMAQIIFDDADNYSIVPTDKDCQWDFEVRDNETHERIAIVEVKDRQMPSTDNRIVKGGVQLESQKYDKLSALSQRWQIPSYYLATFTDGKFYMWDIVGSKVTEDYRYCNKTTAEDNGKVLKHCYYFKTDDCVFEGSI